MTISPLCSSSSAIHLNFAEGIFRHLSVQVTTAAAATPAHLIYPVGQSITSRHHRILPLVLEQQLGNQLGAALVRLNQQQAWSSHRSSVESRRTFAGANGLLLPVKFGGGRCWHTASNQRSWTKSCRRALVKMATLKRDQVGPGQESVWDYPRPPRMESVSEKIKIVFNGETVAETTDAYRILETSHPPVYYIPTTDVKMEYITRVAGSSFCEWKGSATWWTVTVGAKTAEKVAWSYENPSSAFLPIKGYLAFNAGPMDACFVGEEKAQPQPGNFYGGWVTSKVVGPFKGGPGSWGW